MIFPVISRDEILLTVGISSVALAGFCLTERWARSRNLRHLALSRRSQRDEELAQLKQELLASNTKQFEDSRSYILSLPTDQLLDDLAKEKLTACDVLRAYQFRALEAHDKTNCLVGLVQEAMELARELDTQYKGDPMKPPLYGLPVSLKGNIKVKDHQGTRGYVQDLYEPVASNDAAIVEALKKLGCVPFVFTNIPESMLSFSSSNPVFGLTRNPHSLQRVPGGSSSGEAALIGAGGSPLGIGSDVAGSIRVPAHFSGVYGFKPTMGRISTLGLLPSNPGRPYACGALGPLGPSVDSLALLMKGLLTEETFQLDPYVIPLPFRANLYESKDPLTIGYYDFDGWTEAMPSCRRVVAEAKEVLSKMGHTLIPFSPPNVPLAVELFARSLTIDGGKYVADIMQKDLIDNYHWPLYRFYSTPLWLKRLFASLIRPFYPRTARILSSQTHSSIKARETYEEVEKYRRVFVTQMQQEGVDALICPAAATTALKPEEPPRLLFFAFSYTFLYNLLDFPAGVVPISRVNKDDVRNATENYPTSEPFERLLKSSAIGSEQSPVGVQVVAGPYQEEIVLRVMKEISQGPIRKGQLHSTLRSQSIF